MFQPHSLCCFRVASVLLGSVSWFNSLLGSSRAAALALQSALVMSLFILLCMTEYFPSAVLFFYKETFICSHMCKTLKWAVSNLVKVIEKRYFLSGWGS